MKRASIFGLIVSVLLLAGAAEAGVTTVQNTVDYTDNYTGVDGPWFAEPNSVLDHSPVYRGMWEDWGWTHSLKARVPFDAVGIESATLEVYAWDVDANDEDAEIDLIYANDVELGHLEDTGGRLWKATTFEIPRSVLAKMWADGEVFIFMDIDSIDWDLAGHRVSLGHSKLTINYLVSGQGVPLRLNIHRFWSPAIKSHFYTGKEAEKTKLVTWYSQAWTYQGVVYHALPDAKEPDSAPVYRFWSSTLLTHFYTINEKEKDKLVDEFTDVWTYEGIAWYAFPEDLAPDDTLPIHRFWSSSLGRHYYTADEAEKDQMIKESADVWSYEGIAWYAYK
jgi:Repeat of unknown function (DUF5648)